ncbi:cyclic GMP-AMP synthase DncV-like nucleotidyltransferase [uncultured Methylophaga sp.]|mgnify:CR=1 FL=1|uniref:cyclic GMP-AMP synthase DncV-like nucleotidyltransferase n=1 Tax=uncultured Methylophaga sp. TaxID=285271 RepID=UPI00259CA989|nr:hypothetical protein [uncultured Methylophaga sp.]|tara:strand:+ start:35071 stop:36051 length:981 start_codon:yes stop_codon:yes gene_type:complete
MPILQRQFEDFHTKILFDVDSSQELRDRRDTLLNNLSDKISDDAPAYDKFTQGSYALYTGIIPLGGNPDFDIGIHFDCSTQDFADPLILKQYVADALKHEGRDIRIRKPCVTVTYKRNGQAIHHVDLAIYVTDLWGQTKIAWGRDSDTLANRTWETSKPKELIGTITNRFSGDQRNQFRRCIRALKRWRDYKIGHGNLPSIGLTVAAFNTFSHCTNIADGKPMDILALRGIANGILGLWNGIRISVNLPVDPYNDLFQGMSDIQMNDFKDRLTSLRDALNDAYDHADTHEACKNLQQHFGVDFPLPPKTETTKKVPGGVAPSGRSA